MARELADGRNTVVAAHAAVGDAGVIECCGAECERRVADPAVAVGRNMIRCLADGEDTVVTASAIVRDAGVIERRRYKRQGGVAGFAIVRSRKVVGRLADGRHAVVAGCAGAEHVGVVDLRHRTEGESRMAIFADVVRCDVHRALADGADAVVALDAVAGDARMIEPCGYPCKIRVAVLASISARNVVEMLTGSGDAVVAVAAGTEDVGVIDLQHGTEAKGRVAVFADIVGADVADAFADGVDAVVARDAVPRDPNVIEGHCLPRIAQVTAVALVGRRWMIGWLAGSEDSVVACAAVRRDRRVIHLNAAQPADLRVTVEAIRRGRNVIGGHGACIGSAAQTVAALTLSRRALKDSALMALRALEKLVCAPEIEARVHVVEIQSRR